MKKWIYSFAIAKLFVIPLVLASIGIYKNTADKPTSAPYIKYSVNPNNPNLIEIFSDGLDYKYLKKAILETSIYKDFGVVRKYATMGVGTHGTLPTLFGDYGAYNRYSYFKNKNETSNMQKYKDVTYRHLFVETGVQHLNDLNDDVDFEKTIVLPVNFTRGYRLAAIGNAAYLKEQDESINVVNWAQARDYIANNGWGIKKTNASSAAYYFLANSAQKSNGKPARVLMNDMLSHLRYIADKNYGFSKQSTVENVYEAFAFYIASYFNALKRIKDKNSGLSAYDNSLIVLYGDHGDHAANEEKTDASKKEIPDHKRNSVFLIKYPHYVNQTSGKPTFLNNTVVYSPFIKKIILDYFQNRSKYVSNDVFSFLKTNKNLRNDKLMLNNDGYTMAFNEHFELIWKEKIVSDGMLSDQENAKVLTYGEWK